MSHGMLPRTTRDEVTVTYNDSSPIADSLSIAEPLGIQTQPPDSTPIVVQSMAQVIPRLSNAKSFSIDFLISERRERS